MSRMIFVNLPIEDVAASRTFFTELGFGFNDNFSDEQTLCLVVSESIFAMLIQREKFADFIVGEIAPRDTTEVLVALSADSRDEVDDLVDRAISAGGSAWREPQDYGFMYGRSFRDLDGHVWELTWMDAAAAAGGPPAQ